MELLITRCLLPRDSDIWINFQEERNLLLHSLSSSPSKPTTKILFSFWTKWMLLLIKVMSIVSRIIFKTTPKTKILSSLSFPSNKNSFVKQTLWLVYIEIKNQSLPKYSPSNLTTKKKKKKLGFFFEFLK